MTSGTRRKPYRGNDDHDDSACRRNLLPLGSWSNGSLNQLQSGLSSPTHTKSTLCDSKTPMITLMPSSPQRSISRAAKFLNKEKMMCLRTASTYGTCNSLLVVAPVRKAGLPSVVADPALDILQSPTPLDSHRALPVLSSPHSITFPP